MYFSYESITYLPELCSSYISRFYNFIGVVFELDIISKKKELDVKFYSKHNIDTYTYIYLHTLTHIYNAHTHIIPNESTLGKTSEKLGQVTIGTTPHFNKYINFSELILKNISIYPECVGGYAKAKFILRNYKFSIK